MYEGHPKSKFPYLVSSKRKEINQIGKKAHIRHTLSFKTSSSFWKSVKGFASKLNFTETTSCRRVPTSGVRMRGESIIEDSGYRLYTSHQQGILMFSLSRPYLTFWHSLHIFFDISGIIIAASWCLPRRSFRLDSETSHWQRSVPLNRLKIASIVEVFPLGNKWKSHEAKVRKFEGLGENFPTQSNWFGSADRCQWLVSEPRRDLLRGGRQEAAVMIPKMSKKMWRLRQKVR